MGHFFSHQPESSDPRLLTHARSVTDQNLALNVAEKGFKISVYNRSSDKTDNAVARARRRPRRKLRRVQDMGDLVKSLGEAPRGDHPGQGGRARGRHHRRPEQHMEPGDIIIDGGNEWYENTERRQKEAAAKGLLYLGMGVSGGEEGARNGPAMMPGGDRAAFDYIEEVVTKVCAQTGLKAVRHVRRPGGCGQLRQDGAQRHRCGDMQLISEAYDVLRVVGGLTNDELATAFTAWNDAELDSFLIEISALILAKQDDQKENGALVDKILDKTGMKGTGKWTVQQAARALGGDPDGGVVARRALPLRLKDERVAAEKVYDAGLAPADAAIPVLSDEEKQALVDDVRAALYAEDLLHASRA